MSLVTPTLFGTINKVALSIDRLREFEPPEGYWLAFSGGKDSMVIEHLARRDGFETFGALVEALRRFCGRHAVELVAIRWEAPAGGGGD